MFDEITSERLQYYVYTLVNPKTNIPFYIGKGNGNRVFMHKEDALKGDEKTLKLLADCLISAQEYEQAIPILLRAAQLSDDGQKYVVLGSLYSQLDQWENAAEAIEKGIKKGNVRNLFQAKLSLGSIFLEMRDFEKAKEEFRFVLKDGEKEDVERANALLRYAESEEYRLKNIAMRRDLIKQNS